MKYLILGKNGLLGNAFVRSTLFQNQIALSHSDLDITDKIKLQKKIEEENPDVIINCTAFTDVTLAEKDDELALQVNGDAVGYLAEICSKNEIKLVHFSTDYIFPGTENKEYLENDEKNPVNKYGASKLAGEQKLISEMDNFLIIRVSWLFGIGGSNFVSVISRLIKERDELNIVSDQFGKVTYTEDVVKATKCLLQNQKNGIYHFANSLSLSRYDFTIAIYDLLREKNQNLQCEIKPIPASEYPDKTPRPSFSILNTEKFSRDCSQQIRDWKSALKDYFEQLTDNHC